MGLIRTEIVSVPANQIGNPIFSGHWGGYSECSCLEKEQIIALDKVLFSSYLIKLKSKI